MANSILSNPPGNRHLATFNYVRDTAHRCGRPEDTWFLDEVFCKINGQLVYLWRAVDQEGEVLDILVQSRRNANTHGKWEWGSPEQRQDAGQVRAYITEAVRA